MCAFCRCLFHYLVRNFTVHLTLHLFFSLFNSSFPLCKVAVHGVMCWLIFLLLCFFYWLPFNTKNVLRFNPWTAWSQNSFFIDCYVLTGNNILTLKTSSLETRKIISSQLIVIQTFKCNCAKCQLLLRGNMFDVFTTTCHNKSWCTIQLTWHYAAARNAGTMFLSIFCKVRLFPFFVYLVLLLCLFICFFSSY